MEEKESIRSTKANSFLKLINRQQRIEDIPWIIYKVVRLSLSTILAVLIALGILWLTIDNAAHMEVVSNRAFKDLLMAMYPIAFLIQFMAWYTSENKTQFLLPFIIIGSYIVLRITDKDNFVAVMAISATMLFSIPLLKDVYKKLQEAYIRKKYPLYNSVLTHEAGHVVMAQLLGLEVEKINLKWGYVTQGKIELNENTIEKIIMSLYAGIVAERTVRENRKFFSISAKSDIEDAKKYMFGYFYMYDSDSDRAVYRQLKAYCQIKEKCERLSLTCEEKTTEALMQNKESLVRTIEWFDKKEEISAEEWRVFWGTLQNRGAEANGEI